MLLAIVAQALALPFFWQIELHIIKKAGKIFTQEEKATEWVLAQAAWQQARIDDHEMLWQGNMYDIKSIEHLPDSVRITAVCDGPENDFWAKHHQLQRPNDPTTSESQAQQVALLLLLVPFEVPDAPFLFFAKCDFPFVKNGFSTPASLAGRSPDVGQLPPWYCS